MAELALIALIGTVLTVLLRTVRPEYALYAGLATGLVLLLSVLGDAAGLFDALKRLAEKFGVDTVFVTTVVRILALTYLTQFGAQLSRDAGQGAIALKLELGGRILITALALPQVITLVEVGAALLSSL